jgi:hypothetical protein
MSKQVTPDQLDGWLNDPVTKAYLDSLDYCLRSSEKAISDGSLVDPANSDITQYNFAYSKGRREILLEAGNPAVILARYERPEVVNV